MLSANTFIVIFVQHVWKYAHVPASKQALGAVVEDMLVSFLQVCFLLHDIHCTCRQLASVVGFSEETALVLRSKLSTFARDLEQLIEQVRV